MSAVVYLMSGTAHMPYLITSLVTLRQHYFGEVRVYCFPESYKIGQRIAEDPKLDVQAYEWQPIPDTLGKNVQFLNKIALLRSLPEDTYLYLDADTTIHHRIDSIFGIADTYGFVATQFCQWVSTGSVIRARVGRLREFPEIEQWAVERVLSVQHPSPNGGVFACNSKSPLLDTWYDWSLLAKSVFIADESVLHVLQVARQDEMIILTGGRWNCSHRYQGKIQDPFIYHYHGDSNVRPDKSPKAHELWWPLYRVCMADNIGGMAEWRKEISNRWLQKLEGF